MSHMKVYSKFLNTYKNTPDNIKMIMYSYQVGFISEIQGFFNIHKLLREFYKINNSKIKTTTVSLNTEIGKIQYPFMI